MRTVLFINAHSRRARRMSDQVVKDFSKVKGFDIIEEIVVRELKDMKASLRTLKAAKNLEAVIVGGGDGTIIAVLNALKDRKDVVYGFLPLGTSNTFVRSLGLPLSYPAAKRTIRSQNIKPASVGSVNGTLFANIAGIGVPAEVTKRITNKVKKFLGTFAYVLTGLKVMRDHTAFYCHVINDEINESFYTHNLLIANGKYHGPLPLNKDISAYDGQLLLVAVGIDESRWSHARAVVSMVFGRQEKDERIRMIPITRALITTQPKRNIEADGEIISRTPATVEIKKNAIKVFAGSREPRSRRRA